MKKILNFVALSIFSLASFGCTEKIATGVWENVVKDNDQTIVKTTITIVENIDEFTGTMVTTIDGKNATTIKVPSTKIDFSGYISGKILVIEKIKDNQNINSFRKSTLTVSDDTKTLVLSPGRLVFYKK